MVKCAKGMSVLPKRSSWLLSKKDCFVCVFIGTAPKKGAQSVYLRISIMEKCGSSAEWLVGAVFANGCLKLFVFAG